VSAFKVLTIWANGVTSKFQHSYGARNFLCGTYCCLRTALIHVRPYKITLSFPVSKKRRYKCPVRRSHDCFMRYFTTTLSSITE
jgi:hypothetical protein